MMGLTSLITRDNAQIVMRNSLIYGSRALISNAATWCLIEVVREAFNGLASLSETKIRLLRFVGADKDDSEKSLYSLNRFVEKENVSIHSEMATTLFNGIFGFFSFWVCGEFVDKFFEAKTPYKYTSFTDFTWKQVICVTVISAVVGTIFKMIMGKLLICDVDEKSDSCSRRMIVFSGIKPLPTLVFFGTVYGGNIDKLNNLFKWFSPKTVIHIIGLTVI